MFLRSVARWIVAILTETRLLIDCWSIAAIWLLIDCHSSVGRLPLDGWSIATLLLIDCHIECTSIATLDCWSIVFSKWNDVTVGHQVVTQWNAGTVVRQMVVRPEKTIREMMLIDFHPIVATRSLPLDCWPIGNRVAAGSISIATRLLPLEILFGVYIWNLQNAGEMFSRSVARWIVATRLLKLDC